MEEVGFDHHLEELPTRVIVIRDIDSRGLIKGLIFVVLFRRLADFVLFCILENAIVENTLLQIMVAAMTGPSLLHTCDTKVEWLFSTVVAVVVDVGGVRVAFVTNDLMPTLASLTRGMIAFTSVGNKSGADEKELQWDRLAYAADVVWDVWFGKACSKFVATRSDRYAFIMLTHRLFALVGTRWHWGI